MKEHQVIKTHSELIRDMDSYRKEVSATPEKAMDFLVRLGVITPSGKRVNLIQ